MPSDARDQAVPAGERAAERRSILRTLKIFLALLVVAVLLIMLGRRNDAVTMAQLYQAGVLTADSVNVSFEKVGGRLVRRLVDEGQQVRRGDTLLEIDDSDFRLAVASDRARVASMEAQIKRQSGDIEVATRRAATTEENTWRQIEELHSSLGGQQAQLAQAKADFERHERLVADRSVSRAEYDRARSAYLQASATVEATIHSLQALSVGATEEDVERLKSTGSAAGMHLSSVDNLRREIESSRHTLAALEASRDELRAALSQDELNLGRTVLRAPEDGKVLNVMFEVGEMVPASSPAVQVETPRQYFDVFLPETRVGEFREGGEVEASCPALGRKVRGKVRYIRAAPSFADIRMTREQGQADLTSFEMRIYVEPTEGLIPGMTLELGD
ncbi:MAG: HlyD family efflux transporter periplasmic adaptor subunit [Succinivibrionaceae bacterium]|nr:HlyD family efflux transporter periplasmic adaptor subunit [Succinivibrionaceae bacterium]